MVVLSREQKGDRLIKQNQRKVCACSVFPRFWICLKWFFKAILFWIPLTQWKLGSGIWEWWAVALGNTRVREVMLELIKTNKQIQVSRARGNGSTGLKWTAAHCLKDAWSRESSYLVQHETKQKVCQMKTVSCINYQNKERMWTE